MSTQNEEFDIYNMSIEEELAHYLAPKKVMEQEIFAIIKEELFTSMGKQGNPFLIFDTAQKIVAHLDDKGVFDD